MNKILEHEHNGQRWLFVEVPQYGNAKAWINPSISNFLHVGHIDGDAYSERLPEGNWQIHADTSTITEAQAMEMVEYKQEQDLNESEPSTTSSMIDIFYPYDYVNKSYYEAETFIESLHSLIRSKGGDPSKRYVVLKEVK